jgi:hypothetical protein
LGKQFSVTAKIDATIINSGSVRFRGTLIYGFFGNTKTVDIFNEVRQISINWSKSFSFSGSFSTSIYVPLPPPVSFIGISFGFSINYGISISLYGKGAAQIVNCVYTF